MEALGNRRESVSIKIGDRVIGVGYSSFGDINGEAGTIVYVVTRYEDMEHCYGIVFDNFINGNNLASSTSPCKDGHGIWATKEKIKLIEEDKANEEETSTLKDFLKINNIVEISCYGEKRLGVVLDNKKIQTTRGYHLISSYDDDLTNYNGTVTNQSIDKIYENTDEGLKLIWDRKDYIDWSNVEVDAKIQVKYSKEDEWENRYFAKVEDGIVYAFSNGGTSFTCGESKTSPWDFARLYEEEL